MARIMSNPNNTGAPTVGGKMFGDTTYTKVFVGGLAWETQRDTMRRYFEQFGEILEAVVITDKNTGRSKGYGFVTFRDPEAAQRACADSAPVIDGRRANCNLACLGATSRTRPSTPQQGNRFRPAPPFSAGPRAAWPGFGGAAFGQFAYQQGFPYPPCQYGYPSYPTSDYAYSQYNPYAAGPQVYGAPGGMTANPAVYPYAGHNQPLQCGPGYGPQAYAPHFLQYTAPGAGSVPHQYGPVHTLAPSTGMTTAPPAPSVLPSPAPHVTTVEQASG